MLFGDGYFSFLAGAAMFGFGMGGIVPMQGAVVGAAFGRESLARSWVRCGLRCQSFTCWECLLQAGGMTTMVVTKLPSMFSLGSTC